MENPSLNVNSDRKNAIESLTAEYKALFKRLAEEAYVPEEKRGLEQKLVQIKVDLEGWGVNVSEISFE